ncbi:MAG: hypothetical protein JWN71_4352 [Xanthobacteraceae bacterium]|nr:hypothetical protein [Xanthobacteraceae bacterium]
MLADAARTRFLSEQGYRVLRFWNNEVLNEIEAVMTKIHATLNDGSRSSPHP